MGRCTELSELLLAVNATLLVFQPYSLHFQETELPKMILNFRTDDMYQGKQCRPRSDCPSRSSLIRVFQNTLRFGLFI